jgi:hypothetical protein
VNTKKHQTYTSRVNIESSFEAKMQFIVPYVTNGRRTGG